MSDTDWKKKCQELENEMILIKGITVHNAPEMREAKKKISELENTIQQGVTVDQGAVQVMQLIEFLREKVFKDTEEGETTFHLEMSIIEEDLN